MGKKEEAVKVYYKAIEINPSSVEALYAKATLLQDLGRFDETLETLDKILKINPNAK